MIGSELSHKQVCHTTRNVMDRWSSLMVKSSKLFGVVYGGVEWFVIVGEW